MTDFFGIGPAILTAFDVYLRAARGSGRTTNLARSLKPGDRVICLNQDHQRELSRELERYDIKDVDITISASHNPHQIFIHGPSQGRVIFDHRWVEEFYRVALEDAGQAIRQFQDQAGGYGPEHIKTREQYRETKMNRAFRS